MFREEAELIQTLGEKLDEFSYWPEFAFSISDCGIQVASSNYFLGETPRSTG